MSNHYTSYSSSNKSNTMQGIGQPFSASNAAANALKTNKPIFKNEPSPLL